MKTLLEQAQAVQSHYRRGSQTTHEEIELTLAWLSGQITMRQVGVALGRSTKSNLSLYLWGWRTLQTAYRAGAIKIQHLKV